METDSPLAGAAGVVVLDPETSEYLDLAVVHANGNTEMVFPHRIAEQVSARLVQFEEISDPVKLSLRDLEGVVRSIRHGTLPSDSQGFF
jgi:hypothetical protein